MIFFKINRKTALTMKIQARIGIWIVQFYFKSDEIHPTTKEFYKSSLKLRSAIILAPS